MVYRSLLFLLWIECVIDFSRDHTADFFVDHGIWNVHISLSDCGRTVTMLAAHRLHAQAQAFVSNAGVPQAMRGQVFSFESAVACGDLESSFRT